MGLAVSDALGFTAQPLAVIPARGKELWDALAQHIQRYDVQRFVLGLPKHLSGTEGAKAAGARRFGAELERRYGLPVEFIDERLSTVAASGALAEAGLDSREQRKTVDQVAAALILQTWLDREAHRKKKSP